MSRPIRVLAVSDSETDPIGALQEALASVEVVRGTEPETAVEALSEQAIDCVVATHRLDAGGGIELLSRVREEWPSLPYFLVVSAGSEAIAAEATREGVTEYVPADSIEPESLADRVDRAVSRARADRNLTAERQAFVQGPAVIFRWGTDPDWPIEFVSENVEDVLGYSPEELESERNYAELVHQADLAHLRTEARKYTNGNLDRLGHDPYRVETREGEYRWVLEHTRTISDPVTGDEQLFGYVIDIMKRREKELELQQFRKAVEQTAHAVYITDPDGRIEYVNPAFEAVTGYDEAAVLGETPRVLQSGTYGEEFYEAFWETIKSGETIETEMVDERADGGRLVLHQTVSPITGEDGAVRKYVAVAQDVTELKEYERTLETQRDNLEILNQVVRHDIRNDLQLVRSYLRMALTDDGPGDGHLERALEATHNAVEMTESAREVTEVMLQTDVDPVPVGLEGSLQRQVEDVRTSHRDIELEVGSIPDVDVRADDMLGSVFRNLLTNAIQHNDRSSPEVVVAAELDGNEAVVEIADNGPGIPEADRERIFEQGRTGIESEGTGLGLYLVRTLLNRYGGSVVVRDNEPTGTVFELRLPLST
ncbi:MAG: PAS domain S-box protein [Halodesulfurarchaeum sp.]